MSDLSPERLFFESVKYIPTQFAIIPYEGDWLIAAAYGAHRTLQGRLTTEELLEKLSSDFQHQHTLAENAAAFNALRAREREARLSTSDLDQIKSFKLELKL